MGRVWRPARGLWEGRGPVMRWGIQEGAGPVQSVGHLGCRGERRCLLCVCQGPSSRWSCCCVGSLQLFRGAPCPSDPSGGSPAVAMAMAVAVRSSAGPDLVGAAPSPSQVLFSRQPESL